MTELWPHQQEAITRAGLQRDLALLHDPGTGKTRTAIEILKLRYNAGKRIQRTLILGPIIVLAQWKRQFEQYSKIPQEKIVVLLGAGKKRLELLESMQKKHPQGFVALLNYDGLIIKGMSEALEKWAPEIMICDESHRLKAPDTARFKALRPVADRAKHCYLLTGSPVLNSPMDLWAQWRIMNRGESFMGFNPRTNRQEPLSFFQFRNVYFYDANAGMPKHAYFPNWKPRPGASEALKRILQQTSVQAKKEDVLKLPPLIQSIIPVAMGKKQEKAYREMESQYVTMVKEHAITASLAIVQSLRLQQILSGFVPNPDKENEGIWFDENPRLEALLEKTEDLVAQGKKVVVWTNFVPTYDKIAQELKKLKIDSVFLTGRESIKVKDANVLAFTKGEIPVCIAHPAAAGLGVELTEAQYSIYYGRSYSQEHLIQSTARNYRGGSEIHAHVTQYDLVVPDTMDDVIISCLDGKVKLAQALLDWANAK